MFWDGAVGSSFPKRCLHVCGLRNVILGIGWACRGFATLPPVAPRGRPVWGGRELGVRIVFRARVAGPPVLPRWRPSRLACVCVCVRVPR
eukprot:6491476-Pyramimonas_sp.AAC.1